MAKRPVVFQAKDRISHTVFGTGTIEEVNSRYTTILFDTEGTRKFLTERVVLAPSDTPPPEKPVRRKKAASKKTTKSKTTKSKTTKSKTTKSKTTKKKSK